MSDISSPTMNRGEGEDYRQYFYCRPGESLLGVAHIIGGRDKIGMILGVTTMRILVRSSTPSEGRVNNQQFNISDLAGVDVADGEYVNITAKNTPTVRFRLMRNADAKFIGQKISEVAPLTVHGPRSRDPERHPTGDKVLLKKDPGTGSSYTPSPKSKVLVEKNSTFKENFPKEPQTPSGSKMPAEKINKSTSPRVKITAEQVIGAFTYLVIAALIFGACYLVYIVGGAIFDSFSSSGGSDRCSELQSWYSENAYDSNKTIARDYYQECGKIPPPVRNGELQMSDIE
ncbi:hypothetical protein [Rhodococcus sp. ARC_M6]|uniref:hypothetical protein n=1 Tax=Rhodococcus sp. ARC_M6 TaxID=2928852 RepID=UPI001FB55BEA|nr:hypothetical protein [Rhodococcus sp. ARC_M6]MCJ0907091.1 hypothetical protein [Rhodococcus sp. ARC_M6]